MITQTEEINISPRHRAFADAYLGAAHFNATKAAVIAGYSERSAYATGSAIMKNHEVSAYITSVLDERAMAASEVLAGLAGHARATMDDFLTIKREKRRMVKAQPMPTRWNRNAVRYVVSDEIEEVSVIRLDLGKAERAGKLHLVKKFTDSPKDGISIELHDSQAALVHIGRHHKLFTDKVQHSGMVQTAGVDLTKLSDEDLDNMEALLAKAAHTAE